MVNYLLIIVLSQQLLASESKGEVLFPVDTLAATKSLTIEKKIILSSIGKWQRFSYLKKKLNCQFYPSCSNYFAHSIVDNSTYIGVIKGLDRILRCNPYAMDYHIRKTYSPHFHKDGRLVDKINPQYNPVAQKSSLLAGILSLIPGLGKVYIGRPMDGILSGSSIMLLSKITYTQYTKGNKLGMTIIGPAVFTLWLSDIYGAYRSAKLAI